MYLDTYIIIYLFNKFFYFLLPACREDRTKNKIMAKTMIIIILEKFSDLNEWSDIKYNIYERQHQQGVT